VAEFEPSHRPVGPAAPPGAPRPVGPLHKQPVTWARRVRRRRLIRTSLGLVVLVAIGVTVGGVVGRSNEAVVAPLATSTSSLGPSGNETDTAPTVTAPATIVNGLPTTGSHISARIVDENILPGSSAWRLGDPAKNHEIEGYADHVSVDMGQPVTLYVSTTAPSFHVDVYRMGYYQGLGARLVETSPKVPGLKQAAATFTPGINMVETSWNPSITLATTTWPEGDYLFVLVASTGKESYVPLTVRNDASTAAFVVINSVTTWQAYNLWGGYDLYQGRDGRASDFANRSRIVSFDRPYSTGDGASDFIGLELPLVSLVESLGLDVTYMTDVDMQRQPDPLLGHKAVISLGHDEYYSLVMRDNLQEARDDGVNLAFLGANEIFRHIRYAPSPLGPDRHEIDYKSAQEDPLYGSDNADVTVDWRDPPNNNPESQITGDFYQCNPVLANMVIVDPDSWLFAGTGATVGESLPKVVGTEYDRYDWTVPGPDDVEILAHSPLVCRGVHDYADATYYTAQSGAGVFTAGTINWIANIDPHCEPDGCAGRVLGLVTENLLAAFGAGPAGLVHPSDPANSTVHEPPPISSSAYSSSSASSSGSAAAGGAAEGP
jgi:hypothetical protein